MKKVYRIENNSDYTGPYNSRYCYGEEWMIKDHCKSNSTPTPYSDLYNYSPFIHYIEEFKNKYPNLEDHEDLVFGFSNIDQLFNWFDIEELNTLLIYGFEIVSYITNDFIESTKQAFFHRNIDNRKIEDLSELIEEYYKPLKSEEK